MSWNFFTNRKIVFFFVYNTSSFYEFEQVEASRFNHYKQRENKMPFTKWMKDSVFLAFRLYLQYLEKRDRICVYQLIFEVPTCLEERIYREST